MTLFNPELPGYTTIPEPELLFHGGKTDRHPLRGLVRHGPYSQSMNILSSVRCALLAPETELPRLRSLLTELDRSAAPKEATNYYPTYPGFEVVFRVPLQSPSDELVRAFPAELDGHARSGSQRELAQALFQCIAQFRLVRSSFDCILVLLPSQWSHCFESEGFNLHDYLKSFCAQSGLPIQIVLESTFQRRCRANVLWGLGQGIFAKAGGVPWKLTGLSADEAFIGIGYAMKKGRTDQEYTTCCSQVFDPDGTGFRFVAYDTAEFTRDAANNPYLSYFEMQSVLSRSLEIYQTGHYGRVPAKVTIHKNTPFLEDEILGALDSFRAGTEVELVQIVQHVAWQGLRFERNRQAVFKAAGYPIKRGTYLPLTADEALLWTQGSVRGVHMNGDHRDVYKEGPLKPTPSPILVRRFSGAGGWHETCSGILGLTKMDWNNNTLYKKIPVTLVYSKVFANIIQQNSHLVDNVFDFRNFM